MKKVIYVLALVMLIFVLSGCNKENNGSTTDTAVAQNVFLSSVPTDDFQNLTLKDFPSTESLMPPKAILWKDKVFVRSTLSHEVSYGPDILEYDLTGNLLAYTDKKILTCSPRDMAVSGDYLFVSCMNVGIYKIDLVKNQVDYFYGEENGLKNTQNWQLTVDGETLWVGTFKGLGKIDIKTNEVEFYSGNELKGVDCMDTPATHVYARNGEVWATLTANAYCAGGASRYDSKNDQWTFYAVKDFKKRDLERVDFDQFLVSDNGVYAVYQDGGPDFETLAKFDSQKKVWDIVYQTEYDRFKEDVSQYLYPTYKFYEGGLKYLPPRETYDSVNIEIGEKDVKVEHLYVFYGAKWIEVPFIFEEYVDITRIDDVYYLLSNLGMDEFTELDKFPKTVATSDNIFMLDRSKSFSTEDKKYVGFFSIDYSEMGGGNNAYGIGVYNVQDKTFFDGKMSGDELSKVFGENFVETGVSFENLQFTYGSGEIKIPVDGGEFVIDLTEQKFFARRSNWISFKNDRLGFEFSYPENFQIDEPDGGSGVTINNFLPDKICENANILWCATSFGVLSMGNDGLLALDGYKETTLNGFTVMEKTGPKMSQGERDESYIQEKNVVFQLDGGKVYIVTIRWPKALETEPEVYDMLKIYDKMLGSFRPL